MTCGSKNEHLASLNRSEMLSSRLRGGIDDGGSKAVVPGAERDCWRLAFLFRIGLHRVKRVRLVSRILDKNWGDRKLAVGRTGHGMEMVGDASEMGGC